MPRTSFTSLLALSIGCSGAPALGTLSPSGPVRLDKLEVPQSFRVLWVGQEMVGVGETGSTRSFLNVYGEHSVTGQRYLLVYHRTQDGSVLVNIVAITGTLSDSILPPIDTTASVRH